MEAMREQHWQAFGWDGASGVPLQQTLCEIGLADL
jgi:hypothetical protein